MWVAGPGAANPGELLADATRPLTRQQAMALAIDLSRRSTPTEGGFCTFQPVELAEATGRDYLLDEADLDRLVSDGAEVDQLRRDGFRPAAVHPGADGYGFVFTRTIAPPSDYDSHLFQTSRAPQEASRMLIERLMSRGWTPNRTPGRHVDHPMTNPMPIDDQIIRALHRHGHPDGRTAPELADALHADHPAVTAALFRLLAAGVIARSRVRLAAWVATTPQSGRAG